MVFGPVIPADFRTGIPFEYEIAEVSTIEGKDGGTFDVSIHAQDVELCSYFVLESEAEDGLRMFRERYPDRRFRIRTLPVKRY